jgi:hypothetical protein
MSLYTPLPVPEVRELTGDSAWAAWDAAVQESDSGFMSLEATEQDTVRGVLSPRSAFRAEAA